MECTSQSSNVGAERTLEDSYQAARLTGLSILSVLKEACQGDLDRVVQTVQIHGLVNCIDGFTDSPKVINGTSELLLDVFGDAGLAARAAVGTNSLPGNMTCEVVSSFEIRT